MSEEKTTQAAAASVRFERDDAATLDEQVASAQGLAGADAPQEQATEKARTAEECQAVLRKRLTSNHGNTLAYLACLKACLGDARPYREVEESLQGSAAFSLSTQTPHTLIGLLVSDGGIERIEVPEEGQTAGGDVLAPSSDAQAAQASVPQTADPDASPAELPAAPADKPVDYLLAITEAGRAVLGEYDAAARLERLVAAEPEGYLDAYLQVLDACQGDGATLMQIEQALAGNPALTCPKRVYAGYFISKLETVGAIAWGGSWRLTDDGERALATLAA